MDVCVMVVVVRSPWKGETEGGDRMGLMGGSRALPGGHHTPGLCHIPARGSWRMEKNEIRARIYESIEIREGGRDCDLEYRCKQGTERTVLYCGDVHVDWPGDKLSRCMW